MADAAVHIQIRADAIFERRAGIAERNQAMHVADIGIRALLDRELARAQWQNKANDHSIEVQTFFRARRKPSVCGITRQGDDLPVFDEGRIIACASVGGCARDA